MDVPGKLPVEAGSEFVDIVDVRKMQSLHRFLGGVKQVVVILLLVRQNTGLPWQLHNSCSRRVNQPQKRRYPRFRTAGVLRKRSKAAERSTRYDVRSSTDRAEDARELNVHAVNVQ